ncbi:MAG: MFS transporter, partial [Chloroflexi bacterium]
MGPELRPPDPQGGARRRLRRRGRSSRDRGRHLQLQRRGEHRVPVAFSVTFRRALVGLAGAGLFVAALDAYVVVTLLPAMTGDVGVTIENFEQATPIVTGFLAGYVVAMPLLGAYSDVRGRIPVYLACLGAFALGSVITATSGLWTFAGLPWMVAGRFVQGIGGGGMVPLALALAADRYRDRARTVAL